MNTLIVVAAIAAIVIGLLWGASRLLDLGFGKRKKAKPAISGSAAERETTRWRAVRIAPGLICCDAVGKVTGQVYLASESPQLPLDGCGERECSCKYIHLEDRRSGGDRRVDLGDLDAYLPINQTNRRRGPSRRATDLAARREGPRRRSV